MAYMNQEKKAKIAAKIKPLLKRYGLKGSLAVRNHSTIVLNLKSGKIDFGGDKVQVNTYWYRDHYADRPEALAFLSEVIPAMMIGNHDRSDAMTDYFDVGWYIDVNIGRWNNPYVLAA